MSPAGGISSFGEALPTSSVMSQYVIDIKNDKQADALIRYLKSLDFIDMKPLKPTQKNQAASQAKAFLTSLPSQASKQTEITNAVKSIRKKHGYQ